MMISVCHTGGFPKSLDPCGAMLGIPGWGAVLGRIVFTSLFDAFIALFLRLFAAFIALFLRLFCAISALLLSLFGVLIARLLRPRVQTIVQAHPQMTKPTSIAMARTP